MSSWDEFISANEPCLESIIDTLDSSGQVYLPERSEIFKMFKIMKPEEVHVVIIGQSPYSNPADASGIPFLSKTGRCTESLKALMREAGAKNYNGMLANQAIVGWMNQGVFLLNVSMTVGIKGDVLDHSVLWKEFTSSFVEYITTMKKNIPVVLMGKDASELESSAKTSNVIKVPHPVARNGGFNNCQVFNKLDNVLGKKFKWF